MRAFRKGRALLATCAVALLAACGGGDEPSAPPAQDLLKAGVPSFTRHGVYWNPAEPGSGFFFEAQGGTGVATFYLYEDDGRPVWYTSAGTFSADTSTRATFSGSLLRYSGGQSDRSTTPRTPTSTVVGSVTFTIEGDTAQVNLPGRSFTAKKFFASGTSRGPTYTQPETGIYWNPAESGRGFTIEVGDGVAVVTVFHYDDSGQPVWHLVNAAVTGEAASATGGDFMAYRNGQTLTSAWKSPTSQSEGRFGLDFSAPCQGKVSFPGMPAIDVQRFAFGGLGAGKECRTPATIPYTPSPTIVATSLFTDVTLRLTTLPFTGYSKTVGGTMPSSVSFSASGNFFALAGQTIYVLVIDPHGFYTGTASVQLRESPPGAAVLLTPKPITQAGIYKAELQFYACLDPACATQFAGSPFKLPYSVFVGP
ncbi:hypothetical protein [Ramlibacter sp.]|uniref:hypothetical protein n=1 Tax=Ramlibacter sp. TaxID=1917967 RepID=UPI0035AFF44C